jgi:hypothetical protein
MNEDDIIMIGMTGSPRKFGFRTQKDFFKFVEPFGIKHEEGNWPCDVMVTNSLTSKTIDMGMAKNSNMPIITYEQLINVFSAEIRKDKILRLKEKIENK